MSHRMVTANRLHDGAVVYLGKDSDWSRNIESGWALEEDEAEKLMAIAEIAVDEQLIVAPYFIDVTIEANVMRPLRFREQIRAKGPTVVSSAAE